ncbi:MAG: hypothetical protein QOD39_2587 [Mycobacterium sp.]|jgi:hypothetical protein|nr:hypothetical protein [Mycobacterium sp.]
MPTISPLIARLFDDPHANHRRVKREADGYPSRVGAKGRIARRRSK